MQKIYEIYSISLFNRSKNESHEYLVSGDEREITKLCKKMSEFSNSSIKDYYDFRLVEFEINDNTDEMYIVRSVNKNALNDFDPEYDRLNTISFVKCQKNRLDDIVDKYNKSSETYELQTEKARVLSVDETYDAFNERLKEFHAHFRINKDFEDETIENSIEL